MPFTKEDLGHIYFHIFELWNRNLPQNQGTITAYLEGFDDARSPNLDTKKASVSYETITDLFSTYIYRKHDIRHISWSKQIETFAYRNKLSWMEAFLDLFASFTDEFPTDTQDDQYTPSLVYNSPPDSNKLEWQEYDLSKNRLSEIQVGNQTLKTGNLLQLADLVGEDYKQTIHYNFQILDPSWDLYEASDKDFKYVRLCHLRNNLEDKIDSETKADIVINRARRILSSFTSEICFFTNREEKYFAYTDHFEIEIEPALAQKEVLLVNQRRSIDSDWDRHFLWSFHHNLGSYAIGFLSPEELFSSIYWDLINSFNYLEWANFCSTFGGWQNRDNITLARLKSDWQVIE